MLPEDICPDCVGSEILSPRRKKLELASKPFATLLDETESTGFYSERFDATGLASGLYFYRLQTGDPSAGSGHSFVDTKKLLLLK